MAIFWSCQQSNRICTERANQDNAKRSLPSRSKSPAFLCMGNSQLQTPMQRSGARARTAAAEAMSNDSLAASLLATVQASLADSKAEGIVAVDLSGKSPIADHMVIASGRSSRHVSAVADKLLQTLKAEGAVAVKVEGLAQADWVLIDAGDVIVHIFRPEVRSFYNLEKLWSSESPVERLAV
jgi:ribosome-associated protein